MLAEGGEVRGTKCGGPGAEYRGWSTLYRVLQLALGRPVQVGRYQGADVQPHAPRKRRPRFSSCPSLAVWRFCPIP